MSGPRPASVALGPDPGDPVIDGYAPAAYITSDAAAIQYAKRGGCPSVTLKIPMRYTHGPVESCSLRNIVATARLLGAAVRTLGADTDLSFA